MNNKIPVTNQALITELYVKVGVKVLSIQNTTKKNYLLDQCHL